MKKHVEIYFEENGLDPADPVICEMPKCSRLAVDIHHIEPRGIGGNPSKDVNENLIAMCRCDHDQAEAGQIPKELLRELARKRIERGCYFEDYEIGLDDGYYGNYGDHVDNAVRVKRTG